MLYVFTIFIGVLSINLMLGRNKLNSGVDGPEGPLGLLGLVGPTAVGPRGALGLKGVMGAPGLRGPTGPTGVDSLDGPPGSSEVGSAGSTGAQGLLALSTIFMTSADPEDRLGATVDNVHWDIKSMSGMPLVNINQIVYNGVHFVCVGRSTTLENSLPYWSTDCLNWTIIRGLEDGGGPIKHFGVSGGNYFTGSTVCWSQPLGMWVCAGYGPQIMVSTAGADGMWTGLRVSAMSPIPVVLDSIKYSMADRAFYATTPFVIMKSVDGLTWASTCGANMLLNSARSLVGYDSTYRIFDLEFIRAGTLLSPINRLVIVGTSRSDGIVTMYSDDSGVTWTTPTQPWNPVIGDFSYGLCLSYNGTILVCSGYHDPPNGSPVYIYYTYDGITWAPATINCSVNPVDTIYWNGTAFIAAITDGCPLYSYDGLTWDQGSGFLSAMSGDRYNSQCIAIAGRNVFASAPRLADTVADLLIQNIWPASNYQLL